MSVSLVSESLKAGTLRRVTVGIFSDGGEYPRSQPTG